MKAANCKRKGTMVVGKEGKERAETEKEDMNVKEVKENESCVADFNMTEGNEEEMDEHIKETAEKRKSLKENGYNAKIETKKGNKPVKDRKIKNGTEKKYSTSEFAKPGIKRKIDQLEESAADVHTKKTNNEKANESKEENILFHKFF